MGSRTLGSSLGRWVEQNAPWAKWPLVFALILGTALWIALTLRREKHQTDKLKVGAFKALTVNQERRTLHLVGPGAVAPGNVAGQLRSFDSAEEAYHYVFAQFGEALYDRIVVHLPGAEKSPDIFERDPALDAAANAAALGRLMHPERDIAPSTEGA